VKGYFPAPEAKPADVLAVAMIVGDPNLSAEISGLIHEAAIHIAFEARAFKPREELLGQLKAANVKVVLLDLDTVGDGVAAAVSGIKGVLPDCYVLALGRTSEADTILGAFRAGCSDYLCSPIHHGLIAAFARIAAEVFKGKLKSPGANGSVIGFLSAKGGCGATTIACHVATELRRLTTGDLLLADLDLTAGGVAFMMRVQPRHDILDAVSNTHRLDASYWRALIASRGGLDIVTAPKNAVTDALPAAESVSETLRFLRTQYRFVLADLGCAVNQFTEPAIDEMDRVFLVATPDLHALRRAGQIAEYFTDKRTPRVDVRLILNRVPHKKKFRLAVPDAARIVGLPVYCEISSQYEELSEASIDGKLAPPNSRVGKDFSEAARMIARLSSGETQQPPFSLSTGWLRSATSLLR
jgi:pilus assembly protein CpaE